MNEMLREKVLDAFELTKSQREAASARGRAIVVTAGAGSGKTSTLVARYTSLLAEGLDLRRVIAVTFTDKAAMEMRWRVRKTLGELIVQAAAEEERQFWVELNSRMDAARISTIHSLCADILRSHPAEAALDPRFNVLDEALGAALRAQVVEDTLSGLVGMPENKPLFRVFEIKTLKAVLAFLLDKRLEVQEAIENRLDLKSAVQAGFATLVQAAEIAGPIHELRCMERAAILEDAGGELAAQVEDLLGLWSQAETELAAGRILECAEWLYRLRSEKMALNRGKRNCEVKHILRSLRDAYDDILNPVCGGKIAEAMPPNAQTEAVFEEMMALMEKAFNRMTASYREALRQLGSLDFDDLEQGAARLLRHPAIREAWQGHLDALLVDEFQDTNQRQREIVEALAGTDGRLFVVGDAKQSIYRFRRADVTVFRSLRQEIRAQGGLPVDLNMTFRSHGPLLDGMNDILKEIMGEEEDPARPYFEPFAPLIPHREVPRPGIEAPHIEFVLGNGEDANEARPKAARALANRLIELKREGQIKEWDEVALLFRAASGFSDYEDVFEEAGIPFVTVAGKGFYDRPEIRDVLNILRALADPTDNLAMAGALRSPAFGLTDGALFKLRWKDEAAQDYWTPLQGDLSLLSGADQARARRMTAILAELLPLVDRIPVAELLHKLVNTSDYRAILAIDAQDGGGGRLWRNLDKLLNDAQASGKVSVVDFLDYLVTINDAGAREGEAPAEAQGSVQLMTIHKSKGLQFPVVVLADAGRIPRGPGKAAFLLPELGLAFKMDPEPLLFRLSKVLEKRQEQAEKHRLLYVALTRAEEKLIISGHATLSKKEGCLVSGWLKELTLAANVDVNGLLDKAGEAVVSLTSSGQAVRGFAPLPESALEKAEASSESGLPQDLPVLPIYAPLEDPAGRMVMEEEKPQRRSWRATGMATMVPPGVIGQMVHKAIEFWLFPDEERLNALLNAESQNAGLAQSFQKTTAIHHAMELLARFKGHPLWQEIVAASERHHEIPFSRRDDKRVQTGYLDLLYRSADGWHIVDFKTDHIQTAEDRQELLRHYLPQVRGYQAAVKQLLGVDAKACICFLDDHGRLELVEVQPGWDNGQGAGV